MQPSVQSVAPVDEAVPKLQAGTLVQTLTVLGLALTARLYVLWTMLAHSPRGWFYTRGVEMGLLADSLVHGKGLSSPFGGETGPTAFIAPGYPLLVAGVFRALGSYSVASQVVIVGAQIAVNLLTVWLMMQLARKLAGQRAARTAAWLAGLFWACSLPLIWMPTIFWDTSLSACLVLGSVAAGLRLRGRFSWRTALVFGVSCGLAGLLNPALLPVLISVVLWVGWQGGLPAGVLARRLAVAGFVGMLVFAPWPVRNARVFHAFIPLRTTVGFELWMGNRAGATGYLDESVFPMYNAGELAAYKAMGEVAYTNHKSELAKAYIASHPGEFLRLTGRRIARFWTGRGNQGGSPIFAVHACLSSSFGLLGFWLLARRRGWRLALLFAVPLLIFPLPYYMTHAEFRYRLVIDPLLTVLAAYAIATISKRRLKSLGSPDSAASETQPQQVLLA